jgi:predicted oxidoreductase
MRTQFVQYDRPHRAAASMVGTSFPFTRWAASMQHKADGPGRSVMVYTYTLETGPAALRWVMEPVVDWLFARQTQRRFARLQHFLAQHADDIVRWQREQA